MSMGCNEDDDEDDDSMAGYVYKSMESMRETNFTLERNFGYFVVKKTVFCIGIGWKASGICLVGSCYVSSIPPAWPSNP